MASANADASWSRDEAADANPDLTRKRQRLSEETETSPHSTDGDVVIEALPPDEVGSTFDNAIALDDDTTMASVPPVSGLSTLLFSSSRLSNGIYFILSKQCTSSGSSHQWVHTCQRNSRHPNVWITSQPCHSLRARSWDCGSRQKKNKASLSINTRLAHFFG